MKRIYGAIAITGLILGLSQGAFAERVNRKAAPRLASPLDHSQINAGKRNKVLEGNPDRPVAARGSAPKARPFVVSDEAGSWPTLRGTANPRQNHLSSGFLTTSSNGPIYMPVKPTHNRTK